jgi:FeS assembly SUF system regulator
MLRLAKLTDYAMLIMSQMANDHTSILSATMLAEMLHLSVPTVSKILKILSEARLVNSIRGAEGGYHLARPAANISVADIITAMEGELAMVSCCDGTKFCNLAGICTLRENWKTINNVVYGLLNKVSIVDMLKPLKMNEEQVTRGIHHGE